MTKEEIKQNFDILSDRIHDNMASEIRGILYNIKSTWNLTNEDLAFFLNTTESRIEAMLSEYWDGRISATTLSRIQALSFGKYGLPGGKLNDCEREMMGDIMGSLIDLNKPKTYEEKVQDVLNLFGVSDDSSLDRLYNAIIDVRNAINKADEDMFINDSNNENKCKCKCKCNKEDYEKDKNEDETNVTASVTCYNSETMDKPNTFKFKFNDINSDETIKAVKDIAKMISGMFKDSLSK